MYASWESFCLTSTEMGLFIRDTEGGVGGWEERVKVDRRPRLLLTSTRTTNVTAVSARHYAASDVLRSCCLSCCAEHASFC